MGHLAIDQVIARSERAKADSDFTYFFSLLLAAEALAKVVILGMVAAINDDKDRNRYRLEYALVRADGIGDWGRVLEDAIVGPASQYLSVEARAEQAELTKLSRAGEWQYDAVASLKEALEGLQIDAEALPAKTDLKRWFRLFATLRNKTRAHGAIRAEQASGAAVHLASSLELLRGNLLLFKRPWAFLYRNLSGKYRISAICGEETPFEGLKRERHHTLPDGIHVHFGSLRRVPLMESDPELQDFMFANGGFNGARFELLSYGTGNRAEESGARYATPPGTLPSSETEGHGELTVQGACFTNAPRVVSDYVPRARLEDDLLRLLLDDKRPIVTLVGRGGIGKTSLALRVLESVYRSERYDAVVWLSARDVDLQLSGPKVVRPKVFSADDVGRLYAELVLSEERRSAKAFKPQVFFEEQLQKCDGGPCLFVFDNFETTQNPLEMFAWIDSHVRLPNKVLITTRLRDFKGDYPVDVGGMDDAEARILVHQTAAALGVSEIVDGSYVTEVVAESGGHPYVIKVLLGEVARTRTAGNIRRLVAGTDDILAALFERTYAALSPCAQRAFLTLSAWNSSVPRLALEAVLVRSTGERHEVEAGIEMLLQFSMAEASVGAVDRQEFIGLPLVATVFGRKKLNISPYRAAVEADVEVLQMLGPSRLNDVHLGLAIKLEKFIGNIAKRVDKGEAYETYAPIVEMICRAYNTGWLLVARWHMEMRSAFGYQKAIEELQRFLENRPPDSEAADAWRMLAHACYQTGDTVGEVHAFVERAQIPSVDINDVSNTANRINELFRGNALGLGKEQKRTMAERVLSVLDRRRSEVEAEDLSRMAWLAIHLGRETKAREYAAAGCHMEPDHYHCQRLAERFGIVL